MDKSQMILVAIVCALLILIPLLISRIARFRKVSRYLKMEIGRSDGSEKKYWERKLKNHYKSLIPFYKEKHRRK